MRAVDFLSGIYMATFAACGVFFLRFFSDSRDRFFLFFGLACGLLSLERIALLLLDDSYGGIWASPAEAHVWVYLIRLSSFLMMVFAIIDKNRRGSQ